MEIIPSSCVSCENKRVVMLPGPEERNIVNWELLSIHVHSSDWSLVNCFVVMLNSCGTTCVPERIRGNISSCIYIRFVCFKEDVGLDSSLLFLKIVCELENWLYSCCNDEYVCCYFLFVKRNTLNLTVSFNSQNFSICDDVNSILFR